MSATPKDLNYYLSHTDEMPTDPKEIEALANAHMAAALESGSDQLTVDRFVDKDESAESSPAAKGEEAKPKEEPKAEEPKAEPKAGRNRKAFSRKMARTSSRTRNWNLPDRARPLQNNVPANSRQKSID